ncbi:MAG: hypothetical protein ACK530_01070 [Alphaproteobacteria bacterium]|jgi:hypothetical protein
MPHSDCQRNDGPTAGQIVMGALITIAVLYVIYLYIRWVIETREGKVFSAVAGGILSVLWLFGAFDQPAYRAAARPAPVRAEATLPSRDYGRLEAFSSGPGWHTSGSVVVLGVPDARPDLRLGRGGFEECVTIAGRTSCSRSSW